ncbi:MFS transporter [Rhizobium sp. P38BS-XIX]|uniref:MFS transporter n=1 Tax=Rhizobium sp. P38BS-XIX TaxID=2726740 RepID=UPI0014570E31|nr:MFS transporter [Rhizobium sp. P38BS-XIX]NLR99852.1 MFS transporter [Rhizobium sp. P38BS-XIX]
MSVAEDNSVNLGADRLTPAVIRQLGGLGACTFGIATTFYLTLSSGPAHVAALGGEPAAGAVTTISTFATVGATLLATKLVALLGRRIVFALATLALGLPCIMLFGTSLYLAEVGSALRGFGLGLSFISTGGLAAALAPPSRRGEVLGIYGLAFSLPAILAVPAGLWLLVHIGPTSLALVATASALLPLLGLGIFPGREEAARHVRLRNLFWAAMAWPGVAQAGGATAVGAMITALAIGGAKGAETAALAMFLHSVGVALARWAGGRIGDHRGQRFVIIAGSTLSLAATLMLGCGYGVFFIIFGAAMLGIAFGLQQNATLSLMLNRGDADPVNAAWNLAYDAGLGIGAFAYGAMVPTVDAGTAMVMIGAGVACVTLTTFLALEHRIPPRTERLG